MANTQFMDTAQTTSKEIVFARDKDAAVSEQIITVVPPSPGTVAYPGGMWELEQQMPSGVWVGQDITWANYGSQRFLAVAGVRYRITGGTAGVEAFTSGSQAVH